MTRARNSANLASHGNLFVDITNDRTGIGSVVPAQNLHVAGTAGFHADVTFTGDLYNTTWDRSANSLRFNDSAQIKLGTDNDANIRHDGSNTWIQNTTGYLYIDAAGSSSGIRLISHAHWQAGAMAAFYKDGGVQLFHDANYKFSTEAYGTNTVGTAVNDGLVVAGVATVTTLNVTGVLTYDDVTSVDSIGIVTARQGIEIPNDTYKFRSGTSLEMQVWHDGTNSLIKDTRDSGKVRIQADNFDIIDKDASTTVFSAAPGGINSAKLHTFGAGIELDETIAHAGDTNTRIRFPSADRITLDTGGVERVGVANTGVYVNDELTISGTNGIPLRMTGNFGTGDNIYMQNNTSGGHVQFGFRTNDTDGNHHRAFITAERGSGASANGKLELLARGGNGINGGFIIDKGVGIQASLSIIPTTDSTYDLGTSSLRWDDIYVDDIDVSGSGTFGNDINVANSIVHVGDTDTSIDFTDNKISFKTGGTTRVSAGNTGTVFTDGVTISGNHQFIREGALGSYEQTTIWNQTSGGYIQIGLRQTDSDGPHHRAIIKASKGTGNVTGKFELLARGPGGGTNRGWIIDAGLGIQANLAVVPETNNTYDLGTSSLKWRDINLGRNLDVGGTITMSTVAGTNTNASLNILFQTAAGVIDGGSALTYNPAQDVLSVNGNHISRQVFRGDGALGTLTCDNHSSTTAVAVSNTIDITTVDNATDAFTLKQGSNEYITVDTTNSSELITLGNRTTGPDVLIEAGTTTFKHTHTNTYSATATTQCGYQSQNLSDTTNTYSALRLTAGSSSPATAQLSSIRTGSGQNDFTIQLESGNTAFEALRITSAGALGVGVNPESNSLIHVKRSSGAKITIESDDNNDAWINYSGQSNEMAAGFDKSASKFFICNSDGIQNNQRVAVHTNGTVYLLAGDLVMHSSGHIEVGNGGNATNPMFLNTSDPNTGIFFPGADRMAFTTGGSERLEFTAGAQVNIGTSGTLKAQINNSVNGHYFVSQCDDNNNGFEIYQQHGSTSSRNTLAVYNNSTGSKHLNFYCRGDNQVFISTNKDSVGLVMDGTSSGTAYGETGATIDFRMLNEVNQFTGDPAARIASYLERGNNGFGLKFFARNSAGSSASNFFPACQITPDYELEPCLDSGMNLGSPDRHWHKSYIMNAYPKHSTQQNTSGSSFSSSSYYDTGFSRGSMGGLDLNGVYIVTLFADTYAAGGGNYSCNYTWIVGMRNQSTNQNAGNSVPLLSVTGHSTNGVVFELRTKRDAAVHGGDEKIQWRCTSNLSEINNGSGRLMRWRAQRIGQTST